jgi:prepilin-type N-terminal cleavage/methylation domain-containing protein
MISLKKQKGFTIVELLIVIVVIGILATLVIVTFTGVQKKARDSKRQTDTNAVDSHVEAYFASTGHYPSYADLSTATWVAANLKGLDPSALQDPKGSAGIANGAGDGTHYGYKVTQSDGSTACETDDTQCAMFTLTATLEGGGIYTKSSH